MDKETNEIHENNSTTESLKTLEYNPTTDLAGAIN